MSQVSALEGWVGPGGLLQIIWDFNLPLSTGVASEGKTLQTKKKILQVTSEAPIMRALWAAHHRAVSLRPPASCGGTIESSPEEEEEKEKERRRTRGDSEREGKRRQGQGSSCEGQRERTRKRTTEGGLGDKRAARITWGLCMGNGDVCMEGGGAAGSRGDRGMQALGKAGVAGEKGVVMGEAEGEEEEEQEDQEEEEEEEEDDEEEEEEEGGEREQDKERDS